MVHLAGQEGVEPPTPGFGVPCSTNWSYWPITSVPCAEFACGKTGSISSTPTDPGAFFYFCVWNNSSVYIQCTQG